MEDTTEIENLKAEVEHLKTQLAEKPAVQEALPVLTDAEKEVKAYQKVASDALTHLLAKIYNLGNDCSLLKALCETEKTLKRFCEDIQKVKQETLKGGDNEC